MDEQERLRVFFRAGAGDFDAIYSGRKGRLARWLDGVFRRDMLARFDEAIKECGDVSGIEILDVGCGTGRYAVALAKGGARVTAVDSAPEMLSIGRKLARDEGVSERCEFVQADFLSFSSARTYSITLAIGYFDYTGDPLPHLKRMGERAGGKLIATFPRFWSWRGPFRKLRLLLKGCPVYFYTRGGIERLLSGSGWRVLELKRVGNLHFVVACRA